MPYYSGHLVLSPLVTCRIQSCFLCSLREPKPSRLPIYSQPPSAIGRFFLRSHLPYALHPLFVDRSQQHVYIVLLNSLLSTSERLLKLHSFGSLTATYTGFLLQTHFLSWKAIALHRKPIYRSKKNTWACIGRFITYPRPSTSSSYCLTRICSTWCEHHFRAFVRFRKNRLKRNFSSCSDSLSADAALRNL